MSDLLGWRIFAIADGQLWAPIQWRYLPDHPVAGRPWVKTLNVARCVADDKHLAPVEDCSCGIRATEDLEELLKMVRQPLPGSQTPMLDEAGALGRVQVSGKLLPGIDMPRHDPATTWRASFARLVDLWVTPAHADAVDELAERYGVPVAVHDTGWTAPPPPAQPKTGRELFLAGLAKSGFGRVNVRKQPEIVLDLADHVRKALYNGISADDVCAVLYRSAARPSFGQVKKFFRLFVDHLCPEAMSLGIGGGYEHAKPVSRSELLLRDLVG